MTTSSKIVATLSAAADAAAARWDRWGPPTDIGYPVPQWTDLLRKDPAQIVTLCEEWLEQTGVDSPELAKTDERLDKLDQAGVRTMTILDSGFPPQLRAIENPPLVIHSLGKGATLHTGVAMVGSREPEVRDLQEVDRFATWLGSHGMTVITGMARGVDKASVIVAARKGGPVLGVVPGSPLEVIPKESREAYVQVKELGCLVSEVTGLPRMSQRAVRSSFLRRNRIISGMSRVVVAFRPRARGGTFNQLEWASRQGRPIIVVGPSERQSFFKAASAHFTYTESGGEDLLRDASRLWTRKADSPQTTIV